MRTFARIAIVAGVAPYLLMTIANVLVRTGALAEARATYEQALARRPTDPQIRAAFSAGLEATARGSAGTP